MSDNWEQEVTDRLLAQATETIAAKDEEIKKLRKLLHCIWLYADWRYVTKQLTTEQKELWADAIAQDPWDNEVTEVDRWWKP